MQASPKLRRGVAWTMLAFHGLVVSGLPLPVSQPSAGAVAASKLGGKDRSRPFPCMDKPCGCDSAERCFTNCCCHTPAETLAWAKARGIEMSVIDALARRVAVASDARSRGCCSSKAKEAEPSCCASAESDVDQAICSDYQSLAAEPKLSMSDSAHEHGAVETDARLAADVRIVILRDMLACGGMESWWAVGGVSLPPPALVCCEIPWPHIATFVLIDVNVPGTGTRPDLPPPRGC